MRLVTSIIVLWFLALLWFSSDGGMSVAEVLGFAYACPPLLVAWIVAFARSDRAGKTRTGSLTGLALLLVGAFAYWTESAIYLRLLASTPALERYAADVLQRRVDPARPVRVGLFQVRETEVLEGGTVRFITAECMLDDCGLAFSPGQPPAIGEDDYDHLLRDWWHWHRSW